MFLLSQTSKSSSYGGSTSVSPLGNINPGILIGGIILAFIITIIVFIAIVEKKKAPRNRFLKWLREFLNFRSILISGLIKFFYLFLATTTTIMGIIVMCSGRDEMILPMVGIGFAVIVFGNIFLRIMLELIMIRIGIWDNTSDMRAVLVKEEEMPEEKAPKTPKEPKNETTTPPAKPEQPAPETPAPETPKAPTPETPAPEIPKAPAPETPAQPGK